MSDLALVVGGCMSCFGIGWAIGKAIKAYRQFFDYVG